DQVDAAFPAQRGELRELRADQTADVHRDDGSGVAADLRRDVVEVERHRVRAAVDELHTATRVRGGGRGCEERVGGHEHVATLDAERPQDDLERARSRAHRDRVLRLVTGREQLFELSAGRPERQLPRGERLIDAGQDLGAVFFRDVYPGRGHAHEGEI